MRRIAVITVGRSDFGVYRPILLAMQRQRELEPQLIVSGAHFAAEFGTTMREIESEGFPIAARIDPGLKGDRQVEIAHAAAAQMAGLADALEDLRPDIVMLLGDRLEMLAAALAATAFNIAIAHVHGGELSYGAIDDAIRHAITKLSHLHFASMEAYAARLRQLGEEPHRITVSGAPSLDNLRLLHLPSLAEVAQRTGCPLSEADPPMLVTFHPETRSRRDASEQIRAFLDGIASVRHPLLFTMPNADAGGAAVATAIRGLCAARPRAWLVENLGTAAYFGLMRAAPAMLGNSSSGIIEAGSFALPVVNVGDRQRGRLHGPNVVDAALDGQQVAEAVQRALRPEFRDALDAMTNPYGDGHAAERIVARLGSVEISAEFLAKRFVDLEPVRP